MGDLNDAIDFYHQALSCKPDDPFSSEMLNKALQEALTTSLTLGEDENDVPDHNPNTPVGIGPSFLQKSRIVGSDQSLLSNGNPNTSTSMMSDDGLASDVDMSVA